MTSYNNYIQMRNQVMQIESQDRKSNIKVHSNQNKISWFWFKSADFERILELDTNLIRICITFGEIFLDKYLEIFNKLKYVSLVSISESFGPYLLYKCVYIEIIEKILTKLLRLLNERQFPEQLPISIIFWFSENVYIKYMKLNSHDIENINSNSPWEFESYVLNLPGSSHLRFSLHKGAKRKNFQNSDSRTHM